MDDRPGEVEKTRVSVTMPGPYLDALGRLVEEGIYLSKGEVVLEGFRLIFRRHGFKPFGWSEGLPEEGDEEARSR